MMTRPFINAFFSIVLLALMVLGCDSERLDDGSFRVDERISVIVDWDGPPPNPSDPFEIKSATFDEKVLQLVVSYSGGCKEHAFTLYTSNHMALSMPPQLTGWVVHDGRDDGCEAYITETLKVDLGVLIDTLAGPFVLHVWSTSSGESVTANYSG